MSDQLIESVRRGVGKWAPLIGREGVLNTYAYAQKIQKMVESGDGLGLMEEGLYKCESTFQSIIETEFEYREPLADKKLEADRIELLNKCQKTKKKLLRAVIYLDKQVSKDKTKLKHSVLNEFWRQLSEAAKDLADTRIDRTVKEVRRNELGEQWDDHVRQIEAESAEAKVLRERFERATKELKAMHQLVSTGMKSGHTENNYTVDDVATATLKRRQTANYHLLNLRERGRIDGKPSGNPLGTWSLTLAEYQIAVNYINSHKEK